MIRRRKSIVSNGFIETFRPAKKNDLILRCANFFRRNWMNCFFTTDLKSKKNSATATDRLFKAIRLVRSSSPNHLEFSRSRLAQRIKSGGLLNRRSPVQIRHRLFRFWDFFSTVQKINFIGEVAQQVSERLSCKQFGASSNLAFASKQNFLREWSNGGSTVS